MGLVYNSLAFLLDAHQRGVRFDETLTLGRQHVTISPERIVALLHEYKLGPSPDKEAAFLAELKAAQWRFEIFSRMLGAKKSVSMDVSDYEGAEIVHDLNLPVSKELHERFDLVIDGGTLEHVF